MKHVKKIAVMATVVGTVGMASVAWAQWTASADGTGAAKAATKAAVGVANASTLNATLYPGADGDVVVTITNSNPYAVSIDSVYHGALTDVTTPAGAACNSTNNGISFKGTWTLASPKAVGAIVAAKSGGTDGTLTLTISSGISMSNSSVDACSGQTFTVPVSVNAQSASGTAVSTASVTP